MSKPRYGNPITHPDGGTVHITKTEVRQATDPTSPAWMAISRCGIEFAIDGSVEPSITKDMTMGIMTEADATCETCRATL